VQNEAAILASLDLGKAKQMIDAPADSPLGVLLSLLCQNVLDEIIQNAFKYDINASGTLMQSFQVSEAFMENGGVTVQLTLPEDKAYWKYIDQGVNGTLVNRGAPNWGRAPKSTQSFKQSITNWMFQRGVQLDDRPNGAQTLEQLNYLIRRHIVEQGKEKRPFVSDVLNENIVSLFREPIERLLGRAIQINIVAPWQ
jgi:hypothetical protein